MAMRVRTLDKFVMAVSYTFFFLSICGLMAAKKLILDAKPREFPL
jgi:hypothetical protein